LSIQPYKTNLAASFPWVGAGTPPGAGPAGGGTEAGASTEAGGGSITAEDRHGVGGYLSISPGEVYVGGGMYMPPRPRIEAFRRAVVADPERVRAILEEPAFVAWFGGAHAHETLQRVPRGYPADHPQADLLRWKDVIFMRRLADDDIRSADLPRRLAEGFATAAPVLRLLAGLA
jgi:uncharacterized protein (TIGR02453 family)